MALTRRDWPDFQELMQRLFEGTPEESWMRVEEFVDDDDTLVVRTELPGIDPDKDVQIDVVNGELHIKAERRETVRTEGEGLLPLGVQVRVLHPLPAPAGRGERR